MEKAMIQSMTGYGRGIQSSGAIKITVELKSVNSRYLDLNIKTPRKLSFLDNDIRQTLKNELNRGKIDVYVSYEEEHDESFKLSYNKGVAKAYMDSLKEMAGDFSFEDNVRLIDLARLPEVFTVAEAEEDEELLRGALSSALAEAITAFKESRGKEGESLKNDILSKLDLIDETVAFIREKEPQIIEDYKARLREKINELLDETGIPIDESRFAVEVTLYSDKVCVDEEIVRLNTHIAHAREVLSGDGDVGKRLDFIAQEMNRESNTILSKCNNAEISERGISLKTTIEKIREQIQNLE